MPQRNYRYYITIDSFFTIRYDNFYAQLNIPLKEIKKYIDGTMKSSIRLNLLDKTTRDECVKKQMRIGMLSENGARIPLIRKQQKQKANKCNKVDPQRTKYTAIAGLPRIPTDEFMSNYHSIRCKKNIEANGW